MIGTIISAIARIRDAENAEVVIDGATVTIAGTIGSDAYSIVFTQKETRALPMKTVTQIVITRGDVVAKIPLISWWWRFRVARFLHRTMKLVCIERAHVALGE